MPTGATSPMTARSIPAADSVTPSIAPSAARIPQRICAASNAGPAGAAVATTPSTFPRAISEFVPTSMNSRSRLSRVSPVASMPATMSPPTYAPSDGNANAGARGCTGTPKSDAASVGGLCVVTTNGAIERGVVHHRGRDARDHVGAERLLAVEHRLDRSGRAGLEVEQRRDHRRRAE